MCPAATSRSGPILILQYAGLGLVSWVVGLLAYVAVLALLIGANDTIRDLWHIASKSLVEYGLVLALVHLPILRALRNRLRGVEPAWPFAATAVLLGFLPTAINALWGVRSALVFFVFFAAAGIVTGFGYVRIHRMIARPGAEADRSSAYPPFVRLGLSLLELPIAFGVFFVVFQGGTVLGCRILPCSDVQGVAVLLLALPAAVVAGIAYWMAVALRRMPLRRRLMLDGAAALLAIVWYAIPQIKAMRAEAEDRAYAIKESQARAQQRAVWIEALKQGAHAPPGVTPPMFDVADDGHVVTATNRGPGRHAIAMARVMPDPAAPGGWRGCTMRNGRYGSPEFYTLDPGESARFFPDPACAKAFTGALIEYRVGYGPPEAGWWSDSAIATPEGRKQTPIR